MINIEEIQKIFKISVEMSEGQRLKSIIFPKPMVDKILEIFQALFIVINIIIAIAEIFFLSNGTLKSSVWMLPLIHLALILFPVYYFHGRPPVRLELNTGLLILKKNILWYSATKELNLNSVLALKRKLTIGKGIIGCDIFALMNDNKKELLVRKIIKNENEYISLSNFISDFLNIKIDNSI